MTIKSLLIANRGEIAIRIARAAAELGIRSVAVHSEDDARALHVRKVDEARPLTGVGAQAYLDIEQIVQVALAAGCDAVHPGYGFLSENAAFARRCGEVGLTFVGPSPEVLELFGDKAQARALAQKAGVPVIPGTPAPVDAGEARAFLASLGPGGAMVIKAVAGGGGRGMRIVTSPEAVDDAFARCESEARAAFGNGELYLERLMPAARHIEVQIVGDGSGAVSHLWERECSLQRRHQKLVEFAPSPSLDPALRDRLLADAVRLAAQTRYRGLGTFEFLIDASAGTGAADYAFIEANPRLQVEHTVTEMVTDVDLVQAQLRLAAGETLAEIGLEQSRIPPPRGHAVQLRINMETMQADGSARPSGGTLAAFDPPSGPGVRVDTLGYAGYTSSPRYDSLLAKLIVHAPEGGLARLLAKADRALSEFGIAGVATNKTLLHGLLKHPAVAANRVDTRFVEAHLDEVLHAGRDAHRELYFADAHAAAAAVASAAGAAHEQGPEGTVAVEAPMQGTVVSLDVREGDEVHAGAQIAVLEAMKMEHIIEAPVSGVVRMLAAVKGETLFEGQAIVFVEPGEVSAGRADEAGELDLGAIRADLAEVRERIALGMDAARPESVARRRRTGQRTARENIDDLVDPGSFIEYGALAVAAQRTRRSIDDLIRNTPGDGIVIGLAAINGDCFPPEKSRCMVLSYDYTVLAGTQGFMNHKKTDRALQVAEQWQVPVVLFAEGGGGRPGDVDHLGVAGLDTTTFASFARLSGLVPRVGVVSGYCFAGNAALLGCCDVIIATRNSSIGMAGPAMIEGGGLGVYKPAEVGPVDVQSPNGVIDILVEDEAEAVAATKRYLSYFQGSTEPGEAPDQRLLRHLIPENRLRVYDIRTVIETLVDRGSVLELRRDFGVGVVTALVRIEGRPFGLIANNPRHLGGAVDADAGDKAARFMQLCDAFDLPMLSLCDTPGFMVGPQAERTALVRHVSRMFVTAASLTVPFLTIVLRKGYGLGAQAMAAGGFHSPLFTVSWPSGEFGGMGLEGAVRLGFRKELEAIEDPQERKSAYDGMVAAAYEKG
ncbi:MAG TPA: carboxyl transferase domain-containing protein, partial [Quisquiliibacterium sp.]|nr:carboxyl transferase domain-containing protein [Quisquiliibacterium sp.]